MRVRFYGFLANAVRKKRLATIRKALAVPEPAIDGETEIQVLSEKKCPQCGQNDWHYVGATVRLHWQPG